MVLFLLFLAVLGMVAVKLNTNQKDSNPSQITAPEFSLYESKKLGISFKHDNRLTVTETKNRISVDDDPNTKLPHYYIEVFSKTSQETLEQAIDAKLLAKFKRSDCFAVKIQSGYPKHDGYNLAEVSYPPDKNPQDENNYPNCNPDYFNTSTARIFWMDPSHPDKFIFISAGQSVLFSTGDIDWQSFKFNATGDGT